MHNACSQGAHAAARFHYTSRQRGGGAQQPAGIRRVGVLMNLSENDLEAQRLITAFRERLAQLGWVDGRNLRMDYRWAGGDIGRIRAFAKELVELSPDIIVG